MLKRSDSRYVSVKLWFGWLASGRYLVQLDDWRHALQRDCLVWCGVKLWGKEEVARSIGRPVRRRHAYQKLGKRTSVHLERVALRLTKKKIGVLLNVRAVFKEVNYGSIEDLNLRRYHRGEFGWWKLQQGLGWVPSLAALLLDSLALLHSSLYQPKQPSPQHR